MARLQPMSSSRRYREWELFDLGVSAETLMVIMRHKDFATTRKFYGAKRAAQSAAEIHPKLVLGEKAEELVRDVESLGKFTVEEMRTLKSSSRSTSLRRAGRATCRRYGPSVRPADKKRGSRWPITPVSCTAPMQERRYVGGFVGGN